MKKLLTVLTLSFAPWIASANDLHVSLPDGQGYQDLQNAMQNGSEITGNASDVTYVLQTINEYLWIAVGIACMVALVIGGIKLIVARGDEAVMKKANNLMIGAIVGIVIAIFSYLLIRLVLNLF